VLQKVPSDPKPRAHSEGNRNRRAGESGCEGASIGRLVSNCGIESPSKVAEKVPVNVPIFLGLIRIKDVAIDIERSDGAIGRAGEGERADGSSRDVGRPQLEIRAAGIKRHECTGERYGTGCIAKALELAEFARCNTGGAKNA